MICPCGQPLHYRTPQGEALIERYIAEFGPTIDITIDGQTWIVPRHYIALHGIQAQTFPAIAAKLGFAERYPRSPTPPLTTV